MGGRLIGYRYVSLDWGYSGRPCASERGPKPERSENVAPGRRDSAEVEAKTKARHGPATERNKANEHAR